MFSSACFAESPQNRALEVESVDAEVAKNHEKWVTNVSLFVHHCGCLRFMLIRFATDGFVTRLAAFSIAIKMHAC